MPKYVDGYIIPVKRSELKAYKKMATLGKKVWMEHGALEYFECVADDLQTKWGLPFAKLCKLKADETVFFSFIVYKSRADRNRVNKLVHADATMQPKPGKKPPPMPFDPKRFSMAGFQAVVAT